MGITDNDESVIVFGIAVMLMANEDAGELGQQLVRHFRSKVEHCVIVVG